METIERASKLLEKLFDQRSIKVTRNKTRQIRFSRNKLDISISYDEKKYYVFLAKHTSGSWRTLEIEASTEEELLSKIEIASKLIEKTPPNPRFVKINDKSYAIEKPYYDEKLLEIDPKESVEEAISAALEAGAKRVAGTIYIIDRETRVKTPYNDASDRNVYSYISLRAFIDKQISGHRVVTASKHEDFKPSEAGRRAGELAKLDSIERHKISPGEYDTIFGPLAFANFVSYLSRGLSIAAVEFGFSPLNPKLLGSEIASDIFSLRSSALKEYIGYKLFDDEVVPVKDVYAIEKGIFKTHLHSVSTALRYNTETTGNAGILDPMPRQVIVEPGDATLEEMISSLDRGLLVSNVRYTRFQSYTTGDFSTIPRDTFLYIENGEIKASVRGLRVNGNALKRLKSIRMLSKERYPIYRREVEIPSVVPYALIEKVTFTEAH